MSGIYRVHLIICLKRSAIQYLKVQGTITNSQHQEKFAVAKRTASLDLNGLVTDGLLKREGKTGKGVIYRLVKGAKGSNGFFQL